MPPVSMILCGLGLILLAWTLVLAWAATHPTQQLRCLRCGATHLLAGDEKERTKATNFFVFVHSYCKRPAETSHESDS